MNCTQLTVGPGPGPGSQEYKWVLQVDTQSSFGSIATAAAKLAEFLSGISFFGFQFDRELLGGWDVTKIVYTDSTIEIYLKEVGSFGIINVVLMLWPYIGGLLRFFGIILLGSQLINLVNSGIEWSNNNAEREQDKQRATCIQEQLAAGKTEAQAIEICQASYPGRNTTDWGSIIPIVAVILGAAYVLGQRK